MVKTFFIKFGESINDKEWPKLKGKTIKWVYNIKHLGNFLDYILLQIN